MFRITFTSVTWRNLSIEEIVNINAICVYIDVSNY